MPEIDVEWTIPGSADRLVAQFIAQEIAGHREYISHTEYFYGRSPDGVGFRPDLAEHIAAELEEAAAQEAPGLSVAIGLVGGEMACVAIVAWRNNGSERFAVIEDLVVAGKWRGVGIGRKVLDEIKSKAIELGCEKIFLESGLGNSSAHQFFEGAGFQAYSKVYALPL